MRCKLLLIAAISSMQSIMVFAADTPPRPQVAAAASISASSKISAVTVYQSSALVTRDVQVPPTPGSVELIVTPLPPSTIVSSLYSEGGDGVRVLTTRFRTRVVKENAEEEVRKLEIQIKELQQGQQEIQKQIQVIEQNQGLLTKMEDFTSSALKQVTDKGMLSAESVSALATFIMDSRLAKAKDAMGLHQKLQVSQEQSQFLQRELAKVSAGSDKTIREAVIVVENERGAAGRVRFNYLVSAAAWRPTYKLRAGKENEPVQLEYLAAIQQQSGEDWSSVELVLSTAQPMLNAAPPELAMLDVTAAVKPPGQQPIAVNGAALNFKSADNRKQVAQYRLEAQSFANALDVVQAQKRFNDAAAVQQSDEISNADFMIVRADPQNKVFQEGQSVTYHLERRHSLPWRDDEQLIEVTRLSLKPDFFYKAVPVLTPHVYRLANLTNDSRHVILPGEASVYLGTDFVGRTQLPLVAVGEQFTAGFGVDPQLQVNRMLVDKTRTIQGGNQVQKFDYRVLVSSYKAEPVRLQLWDRLPHAETEAVNVVLVSTSKDLSGDSSYVRDDRPKNLLRWDLTVEPGMRGEKAMQVTYQYRLEFAREASIERFISR